MGGGSRASRTIAIAALLLAAAWPSAATAAWHQPIAAPLNVDATKFADNATIAELGGVPYVAWREQDGTGTFQVRAARLDDGGWTALGGSLNVDTTKAVDNPSIAAIGGTPYVAWSETNGTADQIRVKALVNGSWSAIGGSLNVDVTKSASSPWIAGVGGVPYVTWTESTATVNQVHVARFDGASWTAVGGPLNVVGTDSADDPRIADVGGIPFVAWDETSGGVAQIRVREFLGGVWTSVGGSLNANPANGATSPMVASVGGVPYVVWEEDSGTSGEVRVARFSGAVWTPVGPGPLNVTPGSFGENTSITSVGGAPVVGWDEGSLGSQAAPAYVARLGADGWTVIGGALNLDPTLHGDSPGVADIGGVPYTTWVEGTGLTAQVRVARLEPDFLSLTATPRLNGASLVAQVRDFGVPLPIGFQYGGGFGSTTPSQSSGGTGTATVAQEISGLMPATTYPFRAFATDGARLTATSAAGTFSTLSPPKVAPVLRRLKLTPAAFRAAAGPAPTPRSRRTKSPRTGTTVSYIETQAATTTFTVQSQDRGVLRGGTCRRNLGRPVRQRGRRCTITTTVGRFRHADAAGKVSFRFSGRIAGHALRPGAYRLLAQAVNKQSARGARVRTSFRILP